MDDFLSELEANISNIGSSKHWKKTIGDTVVWLSPITLSGQEKVTELITNAETMGMNIINETKRVTLSFSIVGINNVDLREFRDNVPRFPIQKDGKTVKVSLDKYIYSKMAAWSAIFIDDVFQVYADLVETIQKENVKGIKFENAKDPETELADLESRVSALRESLGKPQLVEATSAPAPSVEPVATPSEPRTTGPVVEVDFDPFARVEGKSPAAPASSPMNPAVTSDSPQKQITDAHGNVINVYNPSPSVSNEVMEPPMSPTRVAPVVVDQPVVNRNPRFSPQR